MRVTSKPISHRELENIAIIKSELITTFVTNELDKKSSDINRTTNIKWKRVIVEETFDQLGLIY